uniref:DNMT1-RFD domain-containing protein n=1 Tax=Macrostomum lignano TaxID=282301 RepID=A0A1I8J8B9_9PLAT
EAGVWKDGFPAIYLSEREWKKLEAARPDLEAAARLHVDKRVVLGSFKAIEASQGFVCGAIGSIGIQSLIGANTIEFTPELWRRMFASRLDKLFKPAPEAPPPAKRAKTEDNLQDCLDSIKPYPWGNLCFESADEEETALAEDRARV